MNNDKDIQEQMSPNDEPSRTPQSRPRRNFADFKKPTSPKEEEKVSYLGKQRTKQSVQRELNKLPASERVSCITENTRIEITKQLRTMRESDALKDGKALYDEYKEFLDDSQMENYDDWFEGFWINSNYLSDLGKRKAEVDFWDKLND